MSIVRSIGAVVVKHGPTIATIAGAFGVVVAGVTACKATPKAEVVKVETDYKVDVIKNTTNDSKAIKKEYLNAGKELVKIYGPSLIIGGVSLGMILGSHRVMCGRNVALAGAYKALTLDYDGYRKRLAERFGPENERAAYYDMKNIEVEDPKTGEKRVVEYVPEDMVNRPTDRSRFFDEQSIYWSDNPEENFAFIMKVLERAQAKYDKEGYLRDSWWYDQLDIPVSEQSMKYGWVKGYSPDVIDFGIFDVYSAASRRFVNGLEPVILLTPNDTYIDDKI